MSIFPDFTKEIALTGKNSRIYGSLRVFAYFSAVAVAVYGAFLILFPTQYFIFDFNRTNARSNNLTNVDLGKEGRFDNGRIDPDKGLGFIASTSGIFSHLETQFDLDRKSPALTSGKVTARKTHQAYFYPEGNPSEISDYLQARNPGRIEDGSLVAYGDSIYVISGEEVLPIDSPETFMALGYDWSAVTMIDADQFSLYEKGPLLSIFSAHPDGTVLASSDGTGYLIKGGKKYPLPDPRKISDFPVQISRESSEISAGCELQKSALPIRRYFCAIPLAGFSGLFGKDYLLQADFGDDIQLENIKVEFRRDPTWDNLRFSAGLILKRAKENYVSQN